MNARIRRRRWGLVMLALAAGFALALSLRQSLATGLASWFAGLWVTTMDVLLRLLKPILGG